MLLKYVAPHISINSAFEPIELPDFTILTGLNGSGKTHLLKAIDKGHCQIDNIPSSSCKYYSLLEFKVSESGVLNSDQVDKKQAELWQHLNSQLRGKTNWMSHAKSRFNAAFLETSKDTIIDHSKNLNFEEFDIWNIDESELKDDIKTKISTYNNSINDSIFRHPNFRKLPQFQNLIKALKKCKKPLHLISFDDFKYNFIPSNNDANHLATSIGLIFTKYKLAQYENFHNVCELISQSDDTGQINANVINEKFEQENPKPWVLFDEILNEIYLSTGTSSVFDFSITNPNDVSLKMNAWKNYTFQPQLIDRKTGGPRNFDELSSGEKVLLALAVSIYEAIDGYEFPRVFLLDEIDATLHPSMIKALIDTLINTFVKRGTQIILATHSPTTVALAPEGAVHIVNKDAPEKKIKKSSNKNALTLITEGYATLSDGLSIFDEISKHKICIITEGKNSYIIEKAFRELGQEGISVLSCFQGNTGKSQLKTLFQFFELVPHSTKVLFVWDCDVTFNLTEKNNTYRYILPKNPKNTVAKKGIENMFPDSVFEGFLSRREDSRGNIINEFDLKRKSDFEKHIQENGTKADFSHFECLLKKIEEIKSS